ncbi:MAG TPA: hypothetical protein VND68_10425 [Chloroflexia bacterium]|nr:hypothetical protein [Chloroflexia bacterium]
MRKAPWRPAFLVGASAVVDIVLASFPAERDAAAVYFRRIIRVALPRRMGL